MTTPSPPLRVLVVTNMYPTAAAPYYGVYVREQVDALRLLGVEVGLEIHLGRDSRWNYARGLVSLTRRLRREAWSMVHCHHTFSALICLAARRLAGRHRGPRRVPLILSFHEGEVFDPAGSRRRHIRNSARLKAFALKRADFVLPVERRMIRTALMAAGYPSADADCIRSRVIPAGIDLDKFCPADASEARRRQGWPDEGPLLFFPYPPGKPAKRYDLALAACEILRVKRPSCRLMVGGQIPYAAMPDAIRASDVLLILTDYEASPTIVKEALACERPLVATDVGDVRECYGDLPGVSIADPDPQAIAAAIEAVLPLSSTPDLGGRRRLIDLGLSLEESARSILDIYQSCR